ncbi:MAG TPA: M1 family metallopeptidase [Acidobacteriaceae bacterium]|nr:M1 family metallopeptidase [Acidobacteriaceae bacterium]
MFRANAAQPPRPAYDPLKTFAPLTLPEAVNRYRASDGAPGPEYWQNTADYEIHANLDPDAKQLSADEVITYTNNSPDRLPSLWLQLDQNTYRRDARAVPANDRPRGGFTGGFILESIEVEQGSKTLRAQPIESSSATATPEPPAAGSATAAPRYLFSDTRMQIQLSEPLNPRGGRLRLHIQYHYVIPGVFGDRTSWGRSRNGEIYDIAQWYPRMAVYDDLHGWDTQPYLDAEFYLEYGTFDYYVKAPWDMIVAGSGQLENPQEVLTQAEMQRLEHARVSDRTVTIRGAAEVADPASRPQRSGDLTWHFHLENGRDVAFSASRAFVWDAARIRLPNGGQSIAMSFYPAENGGSDAWGRSTEYLKHAVEEFSRRWFPYPYPAAINVAGPTDGMEYPGIVFDGVSDRGKTLFWITAHEIGHTWFPMIVGSNERRNAWMDEGFNTFIDVYESEAFEGGVYGPKRDSEYSAGGEPAETILKLLDDPDAPPIMTRADVIPQKIYHTVSYFKTAYGLVLLREQILGPERFDWAFRNYIQEWAFKHPSPSDFFRAMESEGGEDLSWFWRGWFMNNWTLDIAVQKASYINGDYRQGAQVTIANLGQLVLPVIVQVNFQDKSSTRITLPVETWMQKGAYTLKVDSNQPIATIIADPDRVIPDDDRSNNVWNMQTAGH